MSQRHERVFLSAFQRLFFRFPREGRLLLERFGTARAAFEADVFARGEPIEVSPDRIRALARFRDWPAAEAAAAKLQSMHGRLVGIADASYPPLLPEIHDAPPVLAARGSGTLPPAAPVVAIVGSRKATRQGLDIAAEIAAGLAGKGFIVASGMAYGIDAAAHRGALAAGGKTVAVLGCGPDVLYPPSHRALAEDIMRSGLILSEFPIGEAPMPANFPQRNRIISGLSVATVVVEAEAKSGSLITARFALEQGREVMAVPGPALASRARGTNGLIREGALLVESADDVAEALQPLVVSMGFTERTGHLKNDAGKDTHLFERLSSRHAIGIDELAMRTGLPVRSLLERLTLLKLEGRVEELAGRRWRLKEKHG